MSSFVNFIVGIAIIVSTIVISAKMGYPRFMNVFHRIAGAGFALLGSLGIGGGAASMIWPQAFDESPPSLSAALVLFPAFALAIVLGRWLLRKPTYRPDLGDTMRFMSNEPWADEVASRANRNWWTGDPKPRRDTLRVSNTRAI